MELLLRTQISLLLAPLTSPNAKNGSSVLAVRRMCLGYLGGYCWSHQETGPKSADINIHLYTSAALKFPVGGKEVQLTQKTDWPWNADVDFEITRNNEVDMTVRLRIPQWAEEFKVGPILSASIGLID